MKRIPLTKGQWATVDDSDFHFLNQFTWHAVKRKYGYHAARRQSKFEDGRFVYMHCVILGITGVDHKDGDGLNNTRSNLRSATKSQNGRGFRTKRKGSSSKFRGVGWHEMGGKWMARLVHNAKQVYLGLYISEISAALAYDTAAKQLYGKFASLNFPDKPATLKS